MAHDFAKKTRPKRATSRTVKKSQVPGWVWLFTGAVLGAFIMFLMRLSEIDTNETSAQQNPVKVTKQKTTAKETPANQKPRFDFYNVLKENQVPVPKPDPDTQQVTPTQPVNYILQVASFKSQADAEELKVKLILLNLDVSLETVTVRNGEQWHRVLVGPFTSRSKLANARSVLVSNNYEALVLKRAVDSPPGTPKLP